MKKYLFMLLAAAVLCGCSKDDDNGGYDGKIHVQKLYYDEMTQTTLARVDVEVLCDSTPTLTFTTEGKTQGIVSPNGEIAFDMDYIYAGEPIDVQYENGRAKASFYYIPLSTGSHTVNFTMNYEQAGETRTTIARSSFSIIRTTNPILDPAIRQAYETGWFHTWTLCNKSGLVCNFRFMYESSDYVISGTGIEGFCDFERDVFHEFPQKNEFCACDPDPQYKYEYKPVKTTVRLICRDNLHRCCDLAIELDENGDPTSWIRGDYYLWRNRK